MIKPRSKAHGPDTYRIVWNRDPALRPADLPPLLPDDAPDEQRKERDAAVDAAHDARAEALRVAREVQDYKALLVDGEQPTYFVCRWIPEATRRRWEDQQRELGGDMGRIEGLAQLLLLALVDVENFGGSKFKERVEADRFGDLAAPESFLDELRRMVGPSMLRLLVTDLGGQVFEQEVVTGPK